MRLPYEAGSASSLKLLPYSTSINKQFANQEFAVVFQTDPQQDGDGEHKLSERDEIEDVVEQVFPGLNHFLE
jgi:hypothetical protein